MRTNKSEMPNVMPHCMVSGSDTTRNHYDTLDDQQLLTLVGVNRDRAALTELYHRFQVPLTRFLQRQLCGEKLIDEVYNDVMLTVWNKAATFRGDSKVSTWLFGIAYRTRLTHSRKEDRHKHVGTEELMASLVAEQQTQAEAQINISESLHAALSELSEPHRTVIELAYFHGYSISEIGQIVRIPPNTVKTRLFHARKNLKAAIEAESDPMVNSESSSTASEDRGEKLSSRSQLVLSAS